MSNRSSPPGSPADRVGAALHDVIQAFQDAQDAAARRQSLHPTDFACISFLHRKGAAASPKEIAGRLGLSSGSATALIDRLEKAGFLHRRPNPGDRRGVLVSLDEEAARAPVARYLELQQGFHAAIEVFSPDELETIARFLARIGALAGHPNPAPQPRSVS